MRSRLGKGYAAIAVMAVAAALLIVSMTAPVASSSADFSIFNSGWNGTSDLAVLAYKTGRLAPSFTIKTSGTDITVEQLALDRIDLNAHSDALVIIGPAKPITSSESRAVGDFVMNGGQLLLADDFGTGNTLLEGMGATSRFSKDLVMDLAYEKQPEFSVLFDLSQDRVMKNTSEILLNYPSSLEVNSTTTEILAQSSIASWLDTNGDRLQEWGEPRGPFPIVAREHMGSGSILLLSDPSVLINGMRKYMDNSVFGNNLIDDVCNERTSVVFDESHRDFFDPITVTMEFTGQVSNDAKAALATLALVLTLWIATDLVDRAMSWILVRARKLIGMIIVAIPIDFLRRRKQPSPERMAADTVVHDIALKHPEWKLGLVRYLLRERDRHAKRLDEKLS